MACTSLALNGLTAHCDKSPGGLKEVYIAQASDVSALTYDASNNNITAITMVGSGKFYKYTFRPGNSSFTSEFTSDVTTGAAQWTSTLELVFTRADANKRLEIEALVNDDVVVIVQDKAKNYIYMGDENPVNSTGATHETGAGSTDRNAYTLTLVTDSEEAPHFVDSEIIEALLA